MRKSKIPRDPGNLCVATRVSLAHHLGRQVSQRELGTYLGLEPAAAERSVRRWETTEPPMWAAYALAHLSDALQPHLPAWTAAKDAADHKRIVRLRFPRIVTVLAKRKPASRAVSVEVAGRGWLVLESEVDRVGLGHDLDALMREAAVYCEGAFQWQTPPRPRKDDVPQARIDEVVAVLDAPLEEPAEEQTASEAEREPA